MKLFLPVLLFFTLFCPSASAHAEDRLAGVVKTAHEAIEIIFSIARKHQNDINKDQMLPVVADVQDNADDLSIANRMLESRIIRAFQKTKLDQKVADEFANPVRLQAITVNRKNEMLLRSLHNIQRQLSKLQLTDTEGKRLDAAGKNLMSQSNVVQKEMLIDFIRDSFDYNRIPLTKTNKQEIQDTMKNALKIIDEVVKRTRETYDALSPQ